MRTKEEVAENIKDMKKVRSDLDNRILILEWTSGKTVGDIEDEIKSLSGLNIRMLALQWALGGKERTQED